MVFELTHDREANKIDLSMKLKWQLHSDEETTFTAFCVTKLKIQIPYDELTAKDYPIQNPFPNLQVTDVLSTLVINNPKEAQELFLKF